MLHILFYVGTEQIRTLAIFRILERSWPLTSVFCFESADIKYLYSVVIPIFKLNPNRYESDLSNEVLCILVAQGIAKLTELEI